MRFSTAAESFLSGREGVHGFVETPQDVFDAGIRAGQEYLGCHDQIGRAHV